MRNFFDWLMTPPNNRVERRDLEYGGALVAVGAVMILGMAVHAQKADAVVFIFLFMIIGFGIGMSCGAQPLSSDLTSSSTSLNPTAIPADQLIAILERQRPDLPEQQRLDWATTCGLALIAAQTGNASALRQGLKQP